MKCATHALVTGIGDILMAEAEFWDLGGVFLDLLAIERSKKAAY